MNRTYSWFLLGLMLVLIAGTGCRGAGRTDRTAPSPSWQMKEFLISHWGFPQDAEQFKQFLADGIETVIAVPEQLPACRENGLTALLATDAGTAAEFVDDPVVWGYFVLDEPRRKEIPYAEVAAKVAAFHKLDPDRPAYVNLNEKDDPVEFIRMVRPRVLSYDYYQWWAGTEPFFPLLEKFRRAALDAGIPLICWVEAVVVPGGPIPEDNLQKVRQSVYSSLAYGAKGIQWWAWRPFDRDAGTLDAELKMLGPALLPLRSVDVFHTPSLPEGTRPIPSDFWIQSPTSELVIGLFTNGRAKDFVFVVNRNVESERTVALWFMEPVDKISRLDKKTGQWAAVSLREDSGQAAVLAKLAPGDGMLLRVKRR